MSIKTKLIEISKRTTDNPIFLFFKYTYRWIEVIEILSIENDCVTFNIQGTHDDEEFLFEQTVPISSILGISTRICKTSLSDQERQDTISCFNKLLDG